MTPSHACNDDIGILKDFEVLSKWTSGLWNRLVHRNLLVHIGYSRYINTLLGRTKDILNNTQYTLL